MSNDGTSVQTGNLSDVIIIKTVPSLFESLPWWLRG